MNIMVELKVILIAVGLPHFYIIPFSLDINCALNITTSPHMGSSFQQLPMEPMEQGVLPRY